MFAEELQEAPYSKPAPDPDDVFIKKIRKEKKGRWLMYPVFLISTSITIWGFAYLLPKVNQMINANSASEGDAIKMGVFIGGAIGLSLGFAVQLAISSFLNIILARKMNRGHDLLLKYYDLSKRENKDATNPSS